MASYYTIPAAFILLLVPNTYAFLAAGKNVDPTNPRQWIDKIGSKEKMDPKKVARILRAKAAASNGLETIGLYAAAVAAAHAAGVGEGEVLRLGVGYLLSRVLYNYVYVAWDERRLAWVRSLVWSVGMGIIFTLFGKAASRTKV